MKTVEKLMSWPGCGHKDTTLFDFYILVEGVFFAYAFYEIHCSGMLECNKELP